MGSYETHVKAISQKMHQIWIVDIGLEITDSESPSKLSNEVPQFVYCDIYVD